ncbi:hypothetical protein F8154_03090 [Alkaliphilus pronyensis]|uniref:Uncharacterized protein n=1 Tax=Alkaliphilus pronyensis TaxID=1482732 RepID=A0A6I0FEB7_9FIRM|nr:hypothetical protein F8154_03090 [Alkaliphilus pronyensis]
MKLHKYLVIIIVCFVANVGCSYKDVDNKTIAYISSNVGSEYENTFKDLNLGVLFDFNFKLNVADKSWVNIWVEGYSNGKAVTPLPITQLSYGLSPNQVEEGKMGFGIINSNSNEPLLFLYSTGVSVLPHTVDNYFLDNSGIYTWDYAIGSETVGIEYGEEIVLAVYRQGKDSIRVAYNYQDSESLKQMIEEDSTVLLLKLKIREADES